MTVKYRFLGDNLRALLPDDIDFSDVDGIVEAFKSKNAKKIAELVDKVAREVRARCSTLNFPLEDHEYGAYKPSRHLGMATNYMGEISRAIESEDSDYSTDEFGWHAYGAVVQAIGGLLEHIESNREGTSPGD